MSKRIFQTLIPSSILALLLLAGTGFTSSAHAQDAAKKEKDRNMQTSRPSAKDMDAAIVAKEIANDSSEIKLTKEALSRIKDDKVKDYANTLIDDHQKDAKKLTDLREDQNIARVKAKMSSAKENSDKLMNRMQTGRGENSYDISFLQMQVKDHQQAINRMKKAESQASNDQLKSHLKDNIEVMQKHLDKAQTLLKNLQLQERGK